jgi:hypothetical protein
MLIVNFSSKVYEATYSHEKEIAEACAWGADNVTSKG